MSQSTTTGGNTTNFIPQASGSAMLQEKERERQLENQLDDLVINEITMQAGERRKKV